MIVNNTIPIAMILLSAVGAQATGQPTATVRDSPSGIESVRVVHHFDFDERPANLEDMPMHWVPFRPPRFPRFSSGSLDESVGRSAPPSFRLSLNGRNVACRYTGADTRVRSNSEYRIVGYIRPDRLIGARACLSAHFLDEQSNPIPGTHVRSLFVGTPESSAATWIEVELRLPSAPPQAHAVGLLAMVTQERVWNRRPRARRHVERIDVDGGAWFDDITMYALPQVEMTTSSKGQVLAPDDPNTLEVIVRDFDNFGLQASLTITDVDGLEVLNRRIAVEFRQDRPPTTIDVGSLGPGLYQARLDVKSAANTIDSRVLTFAKLAKRHRRSVSDAVSFGVVLSASARADPNTEAALLVKSAVRSAKTPLWTGKADVASSPARQAARHDEYRLLQKDGFLLTAVLAGPAAAMVRSAGPYPRPLLEILADDPSGWRDHLAQTVAPCVGIFRRWQLGADDDRRVVDDDRLIVALDRLRAEMRPFLTAPLLGVPASSDVHPWPRRPLADHICLTIGPDVRTDWIAAHVAVFRDMGYPRLYAYLPAPATGVWHRRLAGERSRLAEWAQRIISARHAGADTVFVPQPWTVREGPSGLLAEPLEQYIVLHTIADLIGDGKPVEEIDLGGDVRALVFRRDGTSVLALWNNAAPPDGSEHAIQLGSASRQIDMWGTSFPLERDNHGRQLLRLSRMPIFVDGVEPWVSALRNSITLLPTNVPFSIEPQTREFSMTHVGSEVISGTVELTPPQSWRIEPGRFRFNLMPGRTTTNEVRLSYLNNESAGQKTILARVTVEGGRRLYFEVPLRLQLGGADVDVWGAAIVEGQDVVFRHVVTNRSDRVLSFRAHATVPGRPRQYHMIVNLGPDETQAVEYRFSTLKGTGVQFARLGLEELGRSGFHNLEVTIP